MSEEKHRKTKKQREDEEAQNQDSTSDSSKESEENAMMVALTIDEYDALEKEIEALQAEVDEKTDQWLRTRADFENYKKRVLRDNERHYQDAMYHQDFSGCI